MEKRSSCQVGVDGDRDMRKKMWLRVFSVAQNCRCEPRQTQTTQTDVFQEWIQCLEKFVALEIELFDNYLRRRIRIGRVQTSL